jgi:hypothetical protein
VDGPRTFDLTVPADLTIVDGLTDPGEVQSALRQYLEGTLGLTTHRESRPVSSLRTRARECRWTIGAVVEAVDHRLFRGGANPRPNADPATIGPVLRDRLQTRRICGIDNNFFGLSGARVTMGELASEFHRQRYPLSSRS